MRISTSTGILSLVVVTSLACSAPPARVDRSLGALREREGVCASGSFVGTPPHRAMITGCLRVGARGTRFDNHEPRLITTFVAEDEYDADLTDWQVMVERDGESILNRAFDSVPSRRRCTTAGLFCREVVADVAAFPVAIGPGTYTLRYRLMNAEAYLARVPPVELTIVLR